MENKSQKGLFMGDTNEGMTPDVNDIVVSIPDAEMSIIDITRSVEEVEKSVDLFNKISMISLKLTKPKDWIIQGKDGLYLMDSGAERIAIAFGIHTAVIGEPKKEWHEDETGRYYLFRVSGKAYSRKLGRYVEDIGTCSQRDKFFGTSGGELKPMEDVDVTMIMKKAMTNLTVQLIKRVAGILSTDMDDLKEAGLDMSKFRKVEYKESSKKADKTLNQEDIEKRREIWDMCLKMAAGSTDEARLILNDHAGFKDKEGNEKTVYDVKTITTSKWIDVVWKKIVHEFKAWETALTNGGKK